MSRPDLGVAWVVSALSRSADQYSQSHHRDAHGPLKQVRVYIQGDADATVTELRLNIVHVGAC